jgi:hypothetical protein
VAAYFGPAVLTFGGRDYRVTAYVEESVERFERRVEGLGRWRAVVRGRGVPWQAVAESAEGAVLRFEDVAVNVLVEGWRPGDEQASLVRRV